MPANSVWRVGSGRFGGAHTVSFQTCCLEEQVEVGCDEADLAIRPAAEVEKRFVRGEIGIGLWSKRFSHFADNIFDGELALQKAKDPIRRNNAGHSSNRFHGSCGGNEFSSGTSSCRPEAVHDSLCKLKKVG